MGIVQHDIYSWEITGKNLIQADNTTKGSQLADKALRNWLSEMDNDQREKFIDALFSVINETGAKKINELSENIIKNTRIIKKSFDNLDDETRKAIVSSLKLLGEAIKKSAVSMKKQG